MGGFDPKRWIKLLHGKVGLSPTVSKTIIRRYGSRELDCLTAFLYENKAKWVALSKKHIIIISFSDFVLKASKGESELEAGYGSDVKIVADYGGLGKPTTREIIDFFNFKIEKEQILEFDT